MPEVVEALQALDAEELILDGEAVALAPGGEPLPFQLTMRRFGRKLDVARVRAELPLAVYFFDCLQRDGVPIIGRPAHERFATLTAAVPAPQVIPRRPARARRRDRLQRSAGEPAIPRRSGAALCAGQGYRPDKRAEDADTIDTVRALHEAQVARGSVTEAAAATPQGDPAAESAGP